MSQGIKNLIIKIIKLYKNKKNNKRLIAQDIKNNYIQCKKLQMVNNNCLYLGITVFSKY